jgi:hypothetical protein
LQNIGLSSQYPINVYHTSNTFLGPAAFPKNLSFFRDRNTKYWICCCKMLHFSIIIIFIKVTAITGFYPGK